MDLLIQTLPPATTLGAVEFGSGIEGIPGVFEGTPAAYTLFPPEPISPNSGPMQEALKANINADDGATDYNGAFAKADADDPSSQARIFLTDGGHDEGTYNEAQGAPQEDRHRHRRQGLRPRRREPDPGGGQQHRRRPYLQEPAAPVHRRTHPGPVQTHIITVGPKTHTLRVTLTWAEPGDNFKLTNLQIKAHGQVVATLSRPLKARKPKKLKVTVARKSSTFTVLKIAHLRPGTLQFAVKAAKASGTVKVTTQVGGETG